MELNDLERQRVEKLQHLRAAGIEPYPPRVHRTHTNLQARMAFEQAEAEGNALPTVTVTGRLVSLRLMGKVAFADIEDGSGKLQSSSAATPWMKPPTNSSRRISTWVTSSRPAA